MTAAAAPPAAAALPDFVYELEPLDWLVIAAAAVCLVVLLREWQRTRIPSTPDVPEEPEE